MRIIYCSLTIAVDALNAASLDIKILSVHTVLLSLGIVRVERIDENIGVELVRAGDIINEVSQ